MVLFHKHSRGGKGVQGLASAINIAAGHTLAGLDDDEGSPTPPAATTSTISPVSENDVAEVLESFSGETSDMDLDSDTQGDTTGSFSQLQFETSPELDSTSPVQKQLPGPTLMDVDSDTQSPTNVVTRTKFSAGRPKTLELKTKSIANSSSSSSMESGTDSPEGDSDTEEQSTSRLPSG